MRLVREIAGHGYSEAESWKWDGSSNGGLTMEVNTGEEGKGVGDTNNTKVVW